MASEVEICNIALTHLGETPNITSIDPPEGSSYAEACATFFPIVRNSLLEMYDWNFAMRRAALASITSHTTAWDYTYPLPADCLKAREIIPNDATADDIVSVAGGHYSMKAYSGDFYARASKVPVDFLIETVADNTLVVMTDLEDAVLRYTIEQVNPTTWTPLFTETMGHYMAAKLSGTVIKGAEGRAEAKSQLGIAIALVAAAAASVRNQEQRIPEHVPPWMNDR